MFNIGYVGRTDKDQTSRMDSFDAFVSSSQIELHKDAVSDTVAQTTATRGRS
jgi:hypothetical protein